MMTEDAFYFPIKSAQKPFNFFLPYILCIKASWRQSANTDSVGLIP